MIKEIIFCTLGTVFFAVTMNAPKSSMKYIFIGALLTTVTERALNAFYGDLISCFTAMLCLVFYCELIARVIKMPSTVILMPSAIPLLPGSSIYYTMLYAVVSDNEKALLYAKATALSGIGISLGAVVAVIIIKLSIEFKNKTNRQ